MVGLDQLIGELLMRHNCVIIPSFGGFVAQQTSACIDYSTGMMTPPKKSLLFNRQLINNDGLLISAYAVSNGMHYTEAQDSVRETVQSWQVQLDAGQRVSIDKVGFLYFDQENNICFEQDRFYNLLLASFGMGQIHFLPQEDLELAQHTIVQHAAETESAAIVFDTEHIEAVEEKEDKPIILHPAVNKKRSWAKLAAAACLLPLGFYSYWIPMKTNVLESGMFSIRDFNPLNKPHQANYVVKKQQAHKTQPAQAEYDHVLNALPQDVQIYALQVCDDLYMPVKVREDAVTQTSIPTPVINETPKPVEVPTVKYEYIVGCFGELSNAQALINNLTKQGFNAHVVDQQKGLHRVSLGSAHTNQELDQLKQAAAAKAVSGWILKK